MTIDKLLAKIEVAPHADECNLLDRYVPINALEPTSVKGCSCWKQDIGQLLDELRLGEVAGETGRVAIAVNKKAKT